MIFKLRSAQRALLMLINYRECRLRCPFARFLYVITGAFKLFNKVHKLTIKMPINLCAYIYIYIWRWHK